MRKRAFTLIELLVVIAIIAILAAILFPVFAQAKTAAQKTVDIARFKQVGTATAMYLGDNDNRYMMSNSGSTQGWGFGPPDIIPGVAMMPYVKNTLVFTCPMDPYSENQRVSEHASDMGWSLTNLSAERRLYALMVRTNMGMNYAFFSPWVIRNAWAIRPGSATVTESEVTAPANTVLFANSIWYRSTKTGQPVGGGNWVIETPCWLDAAGAWLRPMDKYANNSAESLWGYDRGWEVPTTQVHTDSWLVYGGMWPFHNQIDLGKIQPGLKDGHAVVQNADTSTKSRSIKTLTAGCTPYGTRQGKLTDPSLFVWDLD